MKVRVSPTGWRWHGLGEGTLADFTDGTERSQISAHIQIPSLGEAFPGKGKFFFLKAGSDATTPLWFCAQSEILVENCSGALLRAPRWPDYKVYTSFSKQTKQATESSSQVQVKLDLPKLEVIESIKADDRHHRQVPATRITLSSKMEAAW